MPKHLVQFYPITLVARDGVTQKFSWVLPLGRVRCIDPERSDVTSKIERSGVTHIISCSYYVHHENCLRGLHLARDEQQLNHIVVSQELRDALAATGESSMFFRPEDIPSFLRRIVH
ncbi:imm11 family protein [Mesorhizobium hawassense]|uniref:imm11 family protein n=1 Tax=Mesorhizobium hawassense TaxID=1209954 RepID=UPI003CCAAB47